MSTNLTTTQNFLKQLTQHQIAKHIGKQHPMPQIPTFEEDQHPFTQAVLQKKMTVDEFTTLATALAPHLQPTFFDQIIAEILPQGGDFPAIGGIKGTNQRSFQPTGETVLFLLAGSTDLARRQEVQKLFDPDHFFAKERILYLEEMRAGEPASSGRLILDPEYTELFTRGKITRPRFGINFPAERLETGMDWEDLVLPAATARQVRELETWLQHGDTLLHDFGMKKRLKPGFRALFYGPPGTGKTLAATLLGKFTRRDVYRVDLSMVVSKFIGETEKNLSNLFAKAENKNWILFFDEADALFGKRTNVRDAHDKYANQEVSYLLQRVESFAGLVILASNFKSNIDDAFMRRFQSIIHFPMPGAAERLTLWQKSFPEKMQTNSLNLPALAQRYELSGASILNVVQYAALRSLERANGQPAAVRILEEDVREGVVREFGKEGKSV